VYDLTNGQSVDSIKSDTRVWRVAITPDSRTVLAAGQGGAIRGWDLESGRSILRAAIERGGSSNFRSIVVTPDSRRVVVAGSFGIQIWNLKNGQLALKLADRENYECVALSPDGSRAVGARFNCLRVWDANRGSLLREVRKGIHSSIQTLAVAPNGRRIVTGSVKEMLVWSLTSGAVLTKLQGGSFALNKTGLALTPEGRWVVAAYDGHVGGFGVWDLDTGEFVHHMYRGTVRRPEPWISALAVTSDRRVVAGDVSGNVWVCMLSRGDLGWNLRDHHNTEMGRDIGFEGNAVLVETVEAGSAAETAGVRDGDVVLAWDRCHYAKADELMDSVTRTTPGQVVELVLYREGTVGTLTVTVREYFSRPGRP
jgi:WD40 repeat protein